MCGDRGYSDERAPVRAVDRNTRGRSRRKIYDDGRAARTARRERRKKTKPTRKTQPSSSEECRHIHTAVQRQRARTEQRVSEINRPHRGAKRSADRAEKSRTSDPARPPDKSGARTGRKKSEINITSKGILQTEECLFAAKNAVHPFLSHIAKESRKQPARPKLTCGTRQELLSAAAVKP